MKKSNKLIRLCSKYGIECEKEKVKDVFGHNWLKIKLLVNDDNRGQWLSLRYSRYFLDLVSLIKQDRSRERVIIFLNDQKL